MIKKTYFIYIALVIITVNNISCKKFLNNKQDKSLIVPSSLFDLQAILDGNTMTIAATPSMGEISCDDYFVPISTFNKLNVAELNYYTWQYYFFATGNDWSNGYARIYNANLCLDILKDIERTNSNSKSYDNIHGSALFFRSYYLLWLLWDYSKAYDKSTANSDLGIILRTSSALEGPTQRATVQECYQLIIKDLKTAIQLLPITPLNNRRPSKIAAYGLLTRCYLSQNDYANALLNADSCLNLNNSLLNYNDPKDFINGLDATKPFSADNKEIIFYSDFNNSNSGIYRTSKSRIDSILINNFNSDDLRLKAYFKINKDGYYQFKGSYGLTTNSTFSGIAVDEILLSRAECYIREENIQKGLMDLNRLLTTRYKTNSFIAYKNLTKDSALNEVLKERRKELILRGLRWMDLKRLNKLGRNIILKRNTGEKTYTLLPNAAHYALPIPEDIINITGMKQNEL